MRHLSRLHPIPRSRRTWIAGATVGVLHLSLTCAATFGDSVVAPSPPFHDQAVQAAQLVDQLGSASFERREEAAASLKKIGAAALTPLRKAATHNDLEVRYRAARLVEFIERAERNRILRGFVADGDLDLGDLLPGWKRFADIVGDDPSSRQLFVDMYRDEPEIMRLTDRGDAELRAAVEARMLEFRQTKRSSASSQMSPATVAVLLFVMLEPNLDISGTARSMIAVVFGQRTVREALTKPGDSALRRLMSHWIAAADDVSPSQRIQWAVQYGFETGVVPSLQLIRAQARGSHLQNAIFSIAKLGGPEHLADLEQLLDDDSVISQREGSVRVDLGERVRQVGWNLEQRLPFPYAAPQSAERPEGQQVVFSSQVRDVALAAMIHLIGHDPRDYGFTELSPHKDYLYTPTTAGFDSEESRDQALRQWRLWTKVQRAQSLDINEIAVEGTGL